MSFHRYTDYAPSGIDWLPQLPAHWEAAPLKHIGDLKGGSGFPHEHQGKTDEALCFHKVNALSQADDNGYLRPSANTVSRETAQRLGAFTFPPESIVFAKVGAALLLGRIRSLSSFACIDNNMMGFVVRQASFDVRFVRYGMSLVRFDLIANPGAVPSLNEKQIGNFRVPVPPLQEQQTIATFLDRETSKIDALVSEQRRLIALLKEKRQAVISHAVTKGLNPAVPMKPSGIPWLGDVPKHWEAVRLGRICNDVADGPHFSPTYVDDNAGGVLFLSARNIKVDRWDFTDVKYVSLKDCDEFDRRVVPEPGDVLYTKGGTTGIARVVDLPMRFQVWVHVAVLKIKTEIFLPGYVALALNSTGSYEQSQLYTRGATNQDLGLTRMVKIRLAMPPREEQSSIVDYLNHATQELDRLITEAERAVALLQERRTALISAAVTGKIDVRELSEDVA